MQLKQLKLSGFKSFVDPTTIPFPSQLVAVVGPNGCGKSNVIDAVRWVMGESSAKNLRGESMADVIFNGSSTRKAVGQASVELVFDNSLGRLTGQYAAYQEISVKRLVTRDGDSHYFLNGTRCRRRDITDIFLGTGAGARGYSIIGQGTISRLVEARPEELRVFLEEAAGVSKYKERRRETQTRITHTRENLARVADIRDELGNQLQKLERQARTAERYQLLKREERACKADILALKWQGFRQQQEQLEQSLNAGQLECEQHQTRVVAAQTRVIHLREQHQDETAGYQDRQAAFYQLATDIALLEENRQQQQRERQRLLNEQQQLQDDWQTQSSQLMQDKQTRQACEQRLETIRQQLAHNRANLASQQQAFDNLSQQKALWQEQTDQIQTQYANASRDEQVAQVRLKHLEQTRQDSVLRLEKIEDERQSLDDGPTAEAEDERRQTLQTLQETLAQAEQEQQRLAHHGETLRGQLLQIETNWQQQQDRFQQLTVEQAALSAALQAAVNADQTEAAEADAWSHYPGLIELMTVDGDWQTACEWVLGHALNARVVPSVDALWPDLASLSAGRRNLTQTASVRPATRPDMPRLCDKIQGVIPDSPVALDTIYTATGLEQALAWLPLINDDESIITVDCCWISRGWLRTPGRDKASQPSLLARQQALLALSHSLIQVESERALLKELRDEGRDVLQQQEADLAVSRQTVSRVRDTLRACEADLRENERIAQQQQQIRARLQDEAETLRERLENLSSEQLDVDESLKTASSLRQQFDEQRAHILLEKSRHDTGLAAQRQQLDEARACCHQGELEQERERLLIDQLNHSLARDEARLEQGAERLEALAEQLLVVDAPDTSLSDALQDKLAQHQEYEEQLADCRDRLATLTLELDEQEACIREEEKRVRSTQDMIQALQLQRQTLIVNETNLAASLADMELRADELLAAMPADSDCARREQELSELAEKIRRLGAINLAAIDEYESEGQRKRYLDEQYDDLMEALRTLEEAIEKMDRETTQRLQQTFDEVNKAFQTLFPRLFGGGQASLVLTCDNLLEAGVMVMAQPPGKRNSTIHLLSGGEKAMTAVALVFAIFQLNPSPFCMLDEVDAPLDDVNVGRFCTLVKEMSQFVQFLFITHNKIAMELADHLIGVTMKEPGVSRVVAVDVEQALAMTELS